MPQTAKVGSIEAIESFRASLIVYVTQARAALEEISSEVLRTRVWLENDQRSYWEREMRNRGRALDEAQQALFSAKLSKFSDGISLEQMAVHRARRAVEECDVKLRILKKWTRDFEGTVQPPLKQVEKLHTILSHDLSKAILELAGTVRTLSDYAEKGRPTSPEPGAVAGAAPSPSTDNTPSPPAS